ncbi:MAG: hypothetical protein WA667_01845 [Candidatus Nitrosopolaris sp.]
MSNEVKSKVYELSNLLSALEEQGGYFTDFISTSGIQAGIIRLHAGEKDTQESHSVDEVYYVIEGNGFIKLDGKDAKAGYRFHGNKEDLVIFYALDGSLR